MKDLILQTVVASADCQVVKEGWKLKATSPEVTNLFGNIRGFNILSKNGQQNGIIKLRTDCDISILYKKSILKFRFQIQRENRLGDLIY